MKLAGETHLFKRTRRQCISIINFLFRSVKNSINLNILKEKNLSSSLFLCKIKANHNKENRYGSSRDI